MRIRRHHWLALLAMTIAIILVLTTAHRRTESPGVTVGFIGYTNSTTGSRFGLFAITNGDRLSIQRLSPGVEIEGTTGLRAPGFSPNLPWLGRNPLKSGAIQTIAVGVPLDPGRWRLCIRFQRRTIAERLRDFVMKHGHPVPVTVGRLTILGPPQYSSTNSSWLTN